MQTLVVLVHNEHGSAPLTDGIKQGLKHVFSQIGLALQFRQGAQGIPKQGPWSRAELSHVLNAHRHMGQGLSWVVHLYLVRRLTDGLYGLMFDQHTGPGEREACAVATETVEDVPAQGREEDLLVREIAHELGHALNLCHRMFGDTIMVPRWRFGPGFAHQFQVGFAPGSGGWVDRPGGTEPFQCTDATDGPGCAATLSVRPWADSVLPGEPLILQLAVHADRDVRFQAPSFVGGTLQVSVNETVVPRHHLGCGSGRVVSLAAGQSWRSGVVVPGVLTGAPVLEWDGGHQVQVRAAGFSAPSSCVLECRYPRTVWEMDLVRALLQSGGRHDTLTVFHARRLVRFLVGHDRPALMPLRRATAALLPELSERVLALASSSESKPYDPVWEDG